MLVAEPSRRVRDYGGRADAVAAAVLIRFVIPSVVRDLQLCMKRLVSVAPVAALAVTGCLASKADIVLLQDEIRTLRAMQSRADTARRAQADSALRATLVAIGRSQDSLRNLSLRFSGFQATVSGELFEMG